MKDIDWVDKKTLAEYLDVSVRSVERFQTLGLPHRKNDDKPYKVGFCIHWYIGYTESKPYGLKQKDGLTLTLFGYAIADLNGAQLQNKGLEIAKLTGHSSFDIGRAIGILKQGNLVRS
jgi:phage terminase Nu1 subunit (DNA packaging protein)